MNKFIGSILLMMFTSSIVPCLGEPKTVPHTTVFHMDKPAENWNEAIPIGNGRLGGMVWGGDKQERIQTNDDTFWSGEPRNVQNPGAAQYLPEIRQLLMDRKHNEAQKLIKSIMINRRLFLKMSIAGSIATIANEKMCAADTSLPLSCLEEENPGTDVPQGAFHLFLLMGQSNMAGYGDILPDDNKDIEGVRMLRNIEGKSDKYNWVSARHPIHARLKSDRFGLAGPFAKTYRELYPQTTVGLIPMAWGGAPITNMTKGTPLYQEVIDKSLWAKKQGKLKAVLWHQGESDTVSAEQAELYESRLMQLIKDIRMDLDEPDLIFIIGNLAEFYGTGTDHSAPQRVRQINKVKESLRNIPDKLPLVGFVESTGLRSHDLHQVHFDRQSYIIFGKRYSDVYWNMINQNSKSV